MNTTNAYARLSEIMRNVLCSGSLKGGTIIPIELKSLTTLRLAIKYNRQLGVNAGQISHLAYTSPASPVKLRLGILELETVKCVLSLRLGLIAKMSAAAVFSRQLIGITVSQKRCHVFFPITSLSAHRCPNFFRSRTL